MLSASSRPLLGLFSGRRVRTETLCPPHRLVLCVISSIAIRSCGARVQCVFRQGDAATSVYLVTNGQLEVVIHWHPIMWGTCAVRVDPVAHDPCLREAGVEDVPFSCLRA